MRNIGRLQRAEALWPWLVTIETREAFRLSRRFRTAISFGPAHEPRQADAVDSAELRDARSRLPTRVPSGRSSALHGGPLCCRHRHGTRRVREHRQESAEDRTSEAEGVDVMTVGDEDLIGRLRALHHEETARASRDLARPAAWTSKPMMRSSLSPVLPIGVAVVIAGIVASLAFFSGGSGIGSTAVASASPTNSTPSLLSPHAEDLQGPFRLAFDLPKDTWRSHEAIDGIATLALLKGGSIELSGSAGSLHGFEFAEVNGSRRAEPVSTAECGAYRLESGKPMTKPITKSAGTSPPPSQCRFLSPVPQGSRRSPARRRPDDYGYRRVHRGTRMSRSASHDEGDHPYPCHAVPTSAATPYRRA